MPGRMTILDRLARSGRIKKLPTSLKNDKFAVDELTFPSVREFDGKLVGLSEPRRMMPERQVYQQGLRNVKGRKMAPIYEEEKEVRGQMNDLQNRFSEAYDDARESMMDDIQYGISEDAPELEYGFDEMDLNFDTPNMDMRDYWPSYAEEPNWFANEAENLNERLVGISDRLDYARSPEYRMQLQTESPRYRNYQRAMENRAANKRMGHQLSRMWGDAYNRLRARGLDDVEARMYLREYFGGR